MATLRFEGTSFVVVGRFERVPRIRIERELAGRGATLHRRVGRKTDYAVVTHAAAGRPASVALGAVKSLDASRRLSEEAFLRELGLAPALAEKDIDESKFLALSGLASDDLHLLALFDVVAPSDGRFGFGDLKIAQHVAGLRQRGAALDLVLKAATELRRRRRGAALSDVTRLDIAPSGDLMMRIGDLLAELDGQMRFAWEQPQLDPDATFEAAEEAENAGDFETAERLYYSCLSAAPRDPVVRFNLGNVLREVGRAAEAKVHYLTAIESEPVFAEALYNLAHLEMTAGNASEAIGYLERAVVADREYPDPLYNLAALYIQLDRFADAAPLLERYVRLDPKSTWAHEARKLLLACRAALAADRGARLTGESVGR